MRLVIALLVAASPALACRNTIPLSEAQKAVALVDGAGSKTCADLKQEPCLCFDDLACDWDGAEIVSDPSRRIVCSGTKRDAAIARRAEERRVRQEKKAAREAAKAELKSVDWGKVKTEKDLAAIIKKMIEAQDD